MANGYASSNPGCPLKSDDTRDSPQPLSLTGVNPTAADRGTAAPLSVRCSGARFPNQNSATRCRCMGDSVRGVLTGGGEAETPGHDVMRSRGGEVLPARNSLRSGCSLCPRDLHTVPGCPTEVHRSTSRTTGDGVCQYRRRRHSLPRSEQWRRGFLGKALVR